MKLTFLGTRGCTPDANRRHRRQTSTLVSFGHSKVLIDCGPDWRRQLDEVAPDAILLTHSSENHVGGLRDGAPCPVHCTDATWEGMGQWRDTLQRERFECRKRRIIGGMLVEAFPLVHAERSPAVGYKITAGEVSVFCAPDVVRIPERGDALSGVRLYVGDAATPVKAPTDSDDTNHASVRDQLHWCGIDDVSRAVFTHCGPGIINGDERKIGPRVRAMGDAVGVEAMIAHDGMELIIR